MRTYTSILSVVVVCAVVFACGGGGGGGDDKAKTPSGARASCHADADCALTSSAGCCGGCPDQPRAIPTLNAEQLKNKCAVVDCATKSDRLECPKVDAITDYVAKCQDGSCAAVKK